MVLVQDINGSQTVKIQDPFSSILLVGAEKMTAGTVEIYIHREIGGKIDLIPKVNVLDLAEVNKHCVIINKDDQFEALLQFSETGNIALSDNDYAVIKFEGLAFANDNTCTVSAIREFQTTAGHNLLKEYTVFGGVKQKSQPTTGFDEIVLPNSADLESVDIVKDGQTQSFTLSELKAVMRVIRPTRVISETLGDTYSYNNWFVLPLFGAETVRVYTTGANPVNFMLNKIG